MDNDADIWARLSFDFVSRAEAMKDVIAYTPEGKGRGGNKPMQRTFRAMRQKRMIAYDVETTNIAEGTPELLYLTAFANYGDTTREPKSRRGYAINLSEPVRGDTRQARLEHALWLLETYLMTPENNGAQFIAWNGNRYDTLLLSQALMLSPRWELHPFLTRSKSVRGLRVIERIDQESIAVGSFAEAAARFVATKKRKPLEFEFLDGMAMTGLDTVSMPLKKFLKLFAPDYQKLTDAIDFEKESFDPNNREHVRYAERDSEGLWYAMVECNRRMRELTGNDLQSTMGRAAIRYFMSQMPDGVKVFRPPEELFDTLHKKCKRGGFVWIQKQFHGEVWKYDLNQAYAGAMRDCELPAGTAIQVDRYVPDVPAVYKCTISRDTPTPIPFYYRDAETEAAGFSNGSRVVETWLCSTEVDHLRADNWRVDISDGWYWPEKFNMADMVGKLERMRYNDPDGPSGPLGTMIKTVGNSGYGKVLELLDGVSIVLAKQCPDGFVPYDMDGGNLLWAKQEEPHRAEYHQPQLGCFITAHVRLQVRDAALQMPDAFIYADTDCVVFSRDASSFLQINATQYGKWKCESAGTLYWFIGKKVYYGFDDDGKEVKHAKGLRVGELTRSDFEAWFSGAKAPSQKQLQRQNFAKMMTGQEMFRYLQRTGTDVLNLKSVQFDGVNFLPL